LQAQDYASVDWANLIEEIEEMSRRERKSLKSNLVVILLYLLNGSISPQRQLARQHSRILQTDQ